ncbi:MAG: bleomycin resistance protein [Clostridiaceae bacterium]|jgi:predicted enzyme related to lactoylglutathione lyase|nr:bleomycin resistance protein [Clostridiaceae bacterium]
MDSVFQQVDCIELYVDDLDAGLAFYRDVLGLALLWRSDTTLGLGMPDGLAEVVLQTDRPRMNVDFKVASVPDAVERILKAGGELIHGPFDIPIGRCAVVRDRWQNEYVILDLSKGTYVTDAEGRVTGVS